MLQPRIKSVILLDNCRLFLGYETGEKKSLMFRHMLPEDGFRC